MDKLRKIAERLWYNKERIVLAVMVVVLCWHVYRIVSPTEKDTDMPNYTIPKPGPIVEPLEETQMPLPPEPRQIAQWKSIVTPNPFWYYSSTVVNKAGDSGAGDEPTFRCCVFRKAGEASTAPN